MVFSDIYVFSCVNGRECLGMVRVAFPRRLEIFVFGARKQQSCSSSFGWVRSLFLFVVHACDVFYGFSWHLVFLLSNDLLNRVAYIRFVRECGMLNAKLTEAVHSPLVDVFYLPCEGKVVYVRCCVCRCLLTVKNHSDIVNVCKECLYGLEF